MYSLSFCYTAFAHTCFNRNREKQLNKTCDTCRCNRCLVFYFPIQLLKFYFMLSPISTFTLFDAI